MYLLKRKITPLTHYLTASVLVIQLILVLFVAQKANAGALSGTMVRFDRIKIGTPTTGTVCARPSSTATETSVKVTFPTSYTVSTTVGNWAVSTATTTGWPSGAVAWPSIAQPTGSGEFVISGQAVNFGSGDLTATTLYCFNWTNTAAITVKGTATADNGGTVITQTTGGAASDTGSWATASISDDQIVISATVPPTFNFSLPGPNTDSFTSNLSTGSIVSTTGNDITITSNAASGWIMWVKGLNGSSGAATKGALKSTSAGNFTIPTTNSNALGSPSHTFNINTQDYGLAVTITTDAAGGGAVSLDAAYDGSTATDAGVIDPNTFRTIASSNGTSSGDVINLKERATINGAVPAATDYTDTLTIIGAGSF